MKQTLSFHSPIIASTQSKVDVEAFEKSTDAGNNIGGCASGLLND